MAQKKPRPPANPDDLPPLFADSFSDEAGGSAPARIELHRINPNGPALIGEPALEASVAELNDFVRSEDRAYGRKGGTYEAILKDVGGRIMKRRRFKVDRDPDLPTERDANAPAPDMFGGVGGAGMGIIAMMEAQARSYEQRVRADMQAREQSAKLDADRREKEWQAQQQRERAYYDQQRERDRELSDQARERDRGMFAFLLETRKNEHPGASGNPIEALMMGMELAREMSGEGGGKRGIADIIAEKFGSKFLDKFAGGDDDARRAAQAKPAAAQPARSKRKPAKPTTTEDDDDDDEDDDGEDSGSMRRMAEMLETLVLNVDLDAAAGVMLSLIKQGKLARDVVGEIAQGKLDEALEFEPEALDKLHKVAEAAYRASSPRKSKGTKPATQ